MRRVTDDALLARYDEEVRAHPQTDAAGYEHAWDGPVFRLTGPTAVAQDNAVLLTRFGPHDDVDAAIARQRAHFAARGHAFEWKLYAHDRPADLAARLAARGFVAGPPETLAVLDVEAFRPTPSPRGVDLVPLSGDGWARIVDLNVAVYGDRAHAEWLARALVDEDRTGTLTGWAAVAGDLVVSAAWARFPAASPSFGSLWGGATLPAWRGRGVYSALVARRVEDARARGRRWLAVDCSEHSLPILVRRGFRPLAVTTPWVWTA